MNHLYYENPYYMQPEFTIPIITAFVLVFIIIVVAYVCVRRAKHRAAANSRKLFVGCLGIVFLIILSIDSHTG
mgnify:FL=1